MTRSDTVVSVTKVTQTWNNVLVLIQAFVNSSSDDLHIGILGLECLDSLWRCQQVQKEDSVHLNASRKQNFHGHHGTSSRGQHRVQQKDISLADVLWQLLVEQLGHGGFFISLNQDLTDSDRSTAVSQTLLHRLTSTDDGNTTDLAQEAGSSVFIAAVALDDGFFHRQLVQSFFNQESDDSVRVENKIASFGRLVSDDGVQANELVCLRQQDDVFADFVGHIWMLDERVCRKIIVVQIIA